jgi:HK97 gp10 family phage protein
MISFTIKGLEQTIKNINNIEVNLTPVLNKALKASATLTLNRLKQNTPVDTGALKGSEKITINGLVATIGPGDAYIPHYAPDVEFGHHTRSGSWVPGQHFIERTRVETNRDIQLLFYTAIASLFK